MDYFTKKGIVVLVVHDSFVVQKRYEDELKKVMNDFYYSEFCFNPVIKKEDKTREEEEIKKKTRQEKKKK